MSATFFGIQLALDLPPSAPARGGLARLVHEHRAALDPAGQRRLWSGAAGLLDPLTARIRLATWDLIRGTGQAAYDEWAGGVERIALWPAEDFGDGGSLLLVTLICQVAGGSNADLTLGDACDLPERAWHRRSTYLRLLQAMPLLNPTNVQASGLYLAPRPDHPGFSLEVLTGEGFEYLVTPT